MAEQQLRVGQQLGHYQLVRLLGQGGFAEVYLGEHVHLKTLAAIKVLHTRLAQEDVQLFQQEAQTVARLLHPNIVRVLDFGVEDAFPYLVMDYALNGTLRHQFPRGSRVPLPTVVAFTRQVAQALQYAHEQRLIHRDIKPENMLLGRNHEVLLSDFGIALVLQSSRLYNTQNIAGTIVYMAPEQIQAHPCFASDQYSLGIVVYEWLCGTRPFQGSFTEIAVKHTITPPPPLRSFVPDLPIEVEQVVMTALQKDPGRRFANIHAFALALEQAALQSSQLFGPTFVKPSSMPLSSSPVMETPAFPASATFRGSGSFSRRALLVAGGMVGMAGVGGVAAWSILSRTNANPASSKSIFKQVGNSTNGTQVGNSTNIMQDSPILTFSGHTAPVLLARWSPDGKLVASGAMDGTVLVWTADEGKTRLSVRSTVQPTQSDDYAWSIDWSPRKSVQHVAAGFVDGTIQVLDANNGQRVSSLNNPASRVVILSWSPDERYLVVGGGDPTIRVYEYPSWRVVTTYQEHTNTVKTVAWSPNGRWIASGSSDTTVRIWEPYSGKTRFIYNGHSKDVATISWAYDSTRVVSTAYDQTARIWEIASERTLQTYKAPGGAPIGDARWSHSNRFIAVYGGDGIVHILNAQTIQVVQSIMTGVVYSLSWSPDDTRIVTANYDNNVRIWHIG